VQFTLTIESGNAAMRNPSDVADSLRGIAARIDAGELEGAAMDANGNTVGRFALETGRDWRVRLVPAAGLYVLEDVNGGPMRADDVPVGAPPPDGTVGHPDPGYGLIGAVGWHHETDARAVAEEYA
jgi:hypothetical protein